MSSTWQKTNLFPGEVEFILLLSPGALSIAVSPSCVDRGWGRDGGQLDSGRWNGTGKMLCDTCWRSRIFMAELWPEQYHVDPIQYPMQEAIFSTCLSSGMSWVWSIVLKKRFCFQNKTLFSGHLRIAFWINRRPPPPPTLCWALWWELRGWDAPSILFRNLRCLQDCVVKNQEPWNQASLDSKPSSAP